MRKDKYRVNGPESAFIDLNNLIETTDQRRDKRSLDQTRSIFGTVGVIAKTNGSALMEADKIKVVCGVHIKAASTTRSEKCFFDFKFAPFSKHARSGFIKVPSLLM